MNLKLPKIYAITDTALSGISHEEQVKRLIEGGITFIQLREKHSSPREFYESAKTAVAIAREHRVTIVINDRADIAVAVNADGVHLGQHDLSPKHARNLLGPNAIIGYSTHTLEQAQAALGLPVDYIAIGPVFATSTKQNPDAEVGIEGIRAVKG
ncbi:MAG: thiamine phosphate synthase, partial [Pyrinomonadaceae bacterium]